MRQGPQKISTNTLTSEEIYCYWSNRNIQKARTDRTDDIAGHQGGEENNGRQGQEGQRKGPEATHRQAETKGNKEAGEATQKAIGRPPLSPIRPNKINSPISLERNRSGNQGRRGRSRGWNLRIWVIHIVQSKYMLNISSYNNVATCTQTQYDMIYSKLLFYP